MLSGLLSGAAEGGRLICEAAVFAGRRHAAHQAAGSRACTVGVYRAIIELTRKPAVVNALGAHVGALVEGASMKALSCSSGRVVDNSWPAGPDDGPCDRGFLRRFLSIRPAH